MIPLPEFVGELRRRIDEESGRMKDMLLSGAAVDFASTEATAQQYLNAVARLQGMERVRQMLDELVRQVNSGGL